MVAIPRTKEEKVSKIQALFRSAQAARADFESGDEVNRSWETIYNYYKAIPPSYTPYKNNIFVPKSFEVVETWLPIVFGTPPKLKIRRVFDTDEEAFDRAIRQKELIEYYMKMGQHKIAMKDFIRQAGIFGTSWLKTYWKYEEKKRVRRFIAMDADGTRILKGEEDTEVVADYPSFEVLSVYDVYPDPNARDYWTMDWVIEKKLITKEELKEMLKLDGFSLPRGVKAEEIGGYYSTNATKPNTSVAGKNYETKYTGEYILLTEFWSKDGELIIIANENYVIYDGGNFFDHQQIPYIPYRVNRPPLEFYGLGLLIPIMPLQEEMNAMRSQRRDNIDYAMNTMFAVKETSPLAGTDIVFRPGAILEVQDPDDIKQLQFHDVTQIAVQEAGLIETDIKRAIGISEYIEGQVVAGMNKTASGVMAMQNMALSRIQEHIDTLETEVISVLAEQFASMLKQYYNTSEPVMVVDETNTMQENIYVTTEDILTEVDYEAEQGSTSPQNKEMRLQNALTSFQIVTMPQITQALNMEGKDINYEFFINNILDAIGIKNKDMAIKQISAAKGQLLASQMAAQFSEAGGLPPGETPGQGGGVPPEMPPQGGING